MKAKLFCHTGLLAGKKFEFSKEATIGKHPGNGIVLDTPIVSGRHARIFFDQVGQCFFLEDLGSRNGTKLDGVRVTEREKLGRLHVITFAETFDFIFHLLDESVQTIEKSRQPQDETREPLANVLMNNDFHKTMVGGEFWGVPPVLTGSETNGKAAVGKAKTNGRRNGKTMIGGTVLPLPNLPFAKDDRPLRERAAQPRDDYLLNVMRLGREMSTFPLKPGENLVGRSPECAICIDDPSISRQHAVLIVSSGKILLKDLGSKNHTFIGKSTVTSEVEIPVATMLRFGTVEAEVRCKT